MTDSVRGALIVGTAAVIVTTLIMGVGHGEECSSRVTVDRGAPYLSPCDAIAWFEGFAIAFLLVAIAALVQRQRRTPVRLWHVALVLAISTLIYVLPMATMGFM